MISTLLGHSIVVSPKLEIPASVAALIICAEGFLILIQL